MPRFNKQGPEGNGPLTGRQQGMCRRTDELSLFERRDDRGRGIEGRSPGGSNINKGECFTQPNVEVLASLEAEYKKTQAFLATLMQKIERIKGVNE